MDELLERKNKTSAEVLSEAPKHDSYSGTGTPHKNWDDPVPLRETEEWKAHNASVKPKK